MVKVWRRNAEGSEGHEGTYTHGTAKAVAAGYGSSDDGKCSATAVEFDQR